SHGVQTKKSVALHAPPALRAQFAGQQVSDGIEIGRNVQSPPHQVVAGIYDDRQFFRTNDLPQSIHELGAARAAGQNRDHAALRAYPAASAAPLRRSASKSLWAAACSVNSG